MNCLDENRLVNLRQSPGVDLAGPVTAVPGVDGAAVLAAVVRTLIFATAVYEIVAAKKSETRQWRVCFPSF